MVENSLKKRIKRVTRNSQLGIFDVHAHLLLYACLLESLTSMLQEFWNFQAIGLISHNYPCFVQYWSLRQCWKRASLNIPFPAMIDPFFRVKNWLDLNVLLEENLFSFGSIFRVMAPFSITQWRFLFAECFRKGGPCFSLRRGNRCMGKGNTWKIGGYIRKMAYYKRGTWCRWVCEWTYDSSSSPQGTPPPLPDYSNQKASSDFMGQVIPKRHTFH